MTSHATHFAATPPEPTGDRALPAPAGGRPAREANPWYPIGSLTTYNVPVVLRWAGWEGTAVWMREGKAAPRWVAIVGTGRTATTQPLPPKKLRLYHDTPAGEDHPATDRMLAARGWADGPSCWRPLRPETWPDALPAPLPFQSAEDVMAQIGRVAFSATEAAAEMEADRLAARQETKKRGTDREREALPWWRDAALTVLHSPPGAITPRECDGRVMRALYFLGHGGATPPELRGRDNAGVLEDLRKAAAQALREGRELPVPPDDTDRVPQLVRTPADTDERLLQALGWACEAYAHTDTLRIVLLGRAANVPLSWSRIGGFLGITRQAAKDRYDRAMLRLTRIANAGTTPGLDRTRAAVIERNRAHANAG